MNKGLLLLVCCSVIHGIPGIDLPIMRREDMSNDTEFLRFRTQQSHPEHPKLLRYRGENETEGNFPNLFSDHALQRPKPIIIDLFMYNGEPMGIYRMMYLQDVVDKFVVVESLHTYQRGSGAEKTSFYIDERELIIQKLEAEEKLKAVKLNSIPMSDFRSARSNNPRNARNIIREQAWFREEYMRNIGLKHVYEAAGQSPFVLIHGDADELPRKEYVAKFAKYYSYVGDGKRLSLANHMYNFKYFRSRPNKRTGWTHPFVITDIGIAKHKTTLSDLRLNFKGYMEVIMNAGWHCSFCMNVTDIIRKIESFSHSERNKKIYKNPDYIQKCIENGYYLFDTDKRVNLFSNTCEYGTPDVEAGSLLFNQLLSQDYCHGKQNDSRMTSHFPPKTCYRQVGDKFMKCDKKMKAKFDQEISVNRSRRV
jgi:hypothetical protein